MSRVLILLILAVGMVRAGIHPVYPVWFKQYHGHFNVTMCSTSLYDITNVSPCRWIFYASFWNDIYNISSGWYLIEIASLYTQCPAFVAGLWGVTCHGKHPLTA